MAQETLRQILDGIKTLEPDELQQVDSAVRERLSPATELRKREGFYQALRVAGLIRHVRSAHLEAAAPTQPITVKGEPISRTIIQDRR